MAADKSRPRARAGKADELVAHTGVGGYDERSFLLHAARELHNMGAKVDADALAEKLGVPLVKADNAGTPKPPAGAEPDNSGGDQPPGAPSA
jgi:hypothetical protein